MDSTTGAVIGYLLVAVCIVCVCLADELRRGWLLLVPAVLVVAAFALAVLDGLGVV